MDDETQNDGTSSEAPATLPTPEALAGMTDAEVTAVLEAANEELAPLRDLAANPADMSDEQADRLQELVTFITDTVPADTARREAEVEARAQRVAEGLARLDGGDEDGGDGEGDDGAGDGDGESGDGEGDGEGEGSEAIAASAGAPAARPAPSRVRQLTRRTPDPRPPATNEDTSMLSIVAAADVGDGIQSGQTLDGMGELTRAFMARSRSFSGRRGVRGEPRVQLNVATIERHHERTADGLYTGNPDFEDDFAVLVAAAKESRLPNGSLTAAGGWCAPSETLYGLCASETLDGIIDVPEVGITRGGINYTEGPDFSDIYTAAGFSQTEAEAIAGETKDCVEITCPDFDEVRLDAVGICVLAPLLTRAGYPELIERWINGTVVANQHKVGARVVTQMSTLLGASPSFTLTGTPTTWALTTALELMAEVDRQKYRLGDNETMEVVLPHWAPIAVRADLANRNGIDERSVSRAQVMEHFTDRNLAPQFVYGLQDLDLSGAVPVAMPATITALIYPAGTFVKGTADVINLDTVYDTNNLQTNTYTAAFVEDGVLVAKMCPGGRKVTVPNLPSGRLGAADLNDPWGTAQA